MLFLQFDLIKDYLNINLFCVTFRFCAYMKTSVWKKSKTSDESLFSNKSLIFSVLVLCNFGLLIVDHILFGIVSSVKCFSTCFDGNRKQITSFLVYEIKQSFITLFISIVHFYLKLIILMINLYCVNG